MPAPLARGLIITVTVLVAASIAAYENPQVRAWIDRTRHKIAMGLHSLGDEIGPRPRPSPRRTSTDISMQEEKGEMAEERRRQAIADIMERGRVLEEQRKRRKISVQEKEQPPSPTFDTLVNQDGILLHDNEAAGQSSGIETEAQSSTLRQRSTPSDQQDASRETPFESRYEQEMREAWNLPLSDRRIEMPPSHASESLIELTPTTESAPDPDFSIPSVEYLHTALNRSEYFSVAASNSTHSLAGSESLSSLPAQNAHQNLPRNDSATHHIEDCLPASLTPSVADSLSNIHASEAEDSPDDVLSEMGDGIRTPGSAWTDVDSTVSGDFRL